MEFFLECRCNVNIEVNQYGSVLVTSVEKPTTDGGADIFEITDIARMRMVEERYCRTMWDPGVDECGLDDDK